MFNRNYKFYLKEQKKDIQLQKNGKKSTGVVVDTKEVLASQSSRESNGTAHYNYFALIKYFDDYEKNREVNLVFRIGLIN